MTSKDHIDMLAEEKRLYDRLMLRSAVQSLFAFIQLSRKQRPAWRYPAPNWSLDRLADMAEAHGVDLIVEARDRVTDEIYTPSGFKARSQLHGGDDG